MQKEIWYVPRLWRFMRHLQRECFAQVVEMKEQGKKREQEDLIDRLYYEETVIYASMEAMDATRTSMDQYNDVLQSDSDQIAAFLKTTLGLKYQIKEQYVGTRFGGFSKVAASGSDDDSPVDDVVLILSVEDPLMFSVNDIYCTAVDGNAAIRVYQALSLKSAVEEHREVTNLLDVNAGSFADILADEYMFAYGIAINIDLYWIYCYDDYGVMDSLTPTKYVWDSADGILTINDSDDAVKSIHTEFRVSFAYDFVMCTCPETSTLRVTIR